MNTIKQQFEAMLNNGIMPLFELEIVNDDKEDDYLIVNIEYNHSGILFSFDNLNLPTHFDGSVESFGYKHLIPFDEYQEEDLDCYLELVMDNMTEGFLLPNNLMRGE